MTNNPSNLPAIRQQGTELGVSRPGGALVSKIAGEATKYLPSLTKKMHRVSLYEVDDQSYQQLLIWLDQFRDAQPEFTLGDFYDWSSQWGEGVHLELGTSSSFRDFLYGAHFDVHFSEGHIVGAKLQSLDLSMLNLSHIPNLTELWCSGNQLTELDLSLVPNLTKLWCYDNDLTEIDLSHVPDLTNLSCEDNKLTEIDIRKCRTSHFYLECDGCVEVQKRPDQSVRRPTRMTNTLKA